MPLTYYKAIDSCHYIPSSNLFLCNYKVIAVWIITVGHRLKSDQHGSMAAQTAPYSRLPLLASIVCNAMHPNSTGRQWSVARGGEVSRVVVNPWCMLKGYCSHCVRVCVCVCVCLLLR